MVPILLASTGFPAFVHQTCRCLQNKRHWHRAHKGEIGDPQGGPGGHSQISRKPGKVRGAHFLKGFGGKLAHPNTSWVPYNPFGSREIPNLHFRNHSSTKPCFWKPWICSKHRPGRVGSHILDSSQIFGSGVQMLVPGTKNQKDARRKTMQNPASRIPNGAIWCKLWPKTILDIWSPQPCCNR